MGWRLPCSKALEPKTSWLQRGPLSLEKLSTTLWAPGGLIHVGQPCFWGPGHVREHPPACFLPYRAESSMAPSMSLLWGQRPSV